MRKITIIETGIKDLLVIEPKLFFDSRGYFFESYNKKDFEELGLHYNFVQDNQSKSSRGVLRGLHFQMNFPQTKLVRVFDGSVFDVAVDIRCGSPTYGKWFGTVLSADNNRQLLIPKGFAHGFLVLSDTAIFCYKCDDFYHPSDEAGIAWDDPDIGINWPLVESPILSEKDKAYPRLNELCRGDSYV